MPSKAALSWSGKNMIKAFVANKCFESILTWDPLIVVYRSSADCWLNDTLLLELFPHNLVSLSPHNRRANDEQVCASSAILIDLILIRILITRMVAIIIFARGVFQILMTAGLLPSPLLFFFSNIHLFLSPPILISVALTIAIMVKSTRI